MGKDKVDNSRGEISSEEIIEKINELMQMANLRRLSVIRSSEGEPEHAIILLNFVDISNEKKKALIDFFEVARLNLQEVSENFDTLESEDAEQKENEVLPCGCTEEEHLSKEEYLRALFDFMPDDVKKEMLEKFQEFEKLFLHAGSSSVLH